MTPRDRARAWLGAHNSLLDGMSTVAVARVIDELADEFIAAQTEVVADIEDAVRAVRRKVQDG